MAEYMLSVHHVEGEAAPDADTMQQMFTDVDALNERMRDSGVWVFAGGLQEPHIATVVREQGTEVVTTDGPFAESKEHLGGFWIIDVPDHATAVDWASRATRACRGPVEVRPFQAGPEG
ncbi:MAG: YciI family protein [Nitriliruptor sp.]